MKIKAETSFFVVLCLVMLFNESSSWWWRRRRTARRSPSSVPQPPACIPRQCTISSWTSWKSCSCPCGYACQKTRQRWIVTVQNSCGSCPYSFSQSKSCNKNRCLNRGRELSYGCSCRRGWTGTCCKDGECKVQFNPCCHFLVSLIFCFRVFLLHT